MHYIVMSEKRGRKEMLQVILEKESENKAKTCNPSLMIFRISQYKCAPALRLAVMGEETKLVRLFVQYGGCKRQNTDTIGKKC